MFEHYEQRIASASADIRQTRSGIISQWSANPAHRNEIE
jgi:hypothetical protein